MRRMNLHIIAARFLPRYNFTIYAAIMKPLERWFPNCVPGLASRSQKGLKWVSEN